MGKNKLKKFAEIERLDCVLQYPREKILTQGFPYKGKWKEKIFHNDNPIVLELGCGKGEYTVALARVNPDKNFVGIDIKGARIWSGAKQVAEEGLQNAMFLRTEIENISNFFAPGEVEEIWITFPDPQMQKTRKRLTSARFLNLYAGFMNTGGIVHLKTDSPFLFEFTSRIVDKNNLEVIEKYSDLYGEGKADPVKSIKTFYESQWLSRGKSIKLLSFLLTSPQRAGKLKEVTMSIFQDPVEDDIPKDAYRAYSHHNPFFVQDELV